MDEKNNDNFWSWIGRQPLSEKVAEDIVVFREEDHPREKGDGKGGRFATKPETIEKQDFHKSSQRIQNRISGASGTIGESESRRTEHTT